MLNNLPLTIDLAILLDIYEWCQIKLSWKGSLFAIGQEIIELLIKSHASNAVRRSMPSQLWQHPNQTCNLIASI